MCLITSDPAEHLRRDVCNSTPGAGSEVAANTPSVVVIVSAKHRMKEPLTSAAFYFQIEIVPLHENSDRMKREARV